MLSLVKHMFLLGQPFLWGKLIVNEILLYSSLLNMYHRFSVLWNAWTICGEVKLVFSTNLVSANLSVITKCVIAAASVPGFNFSRKYVKNCNEINVRSSFNHNSLSIQNCLQLGMNNVLLKDTSMYNTYFHLLFSLRH